jgi:hypothetical protein
VGLKLARPLLFRCPYSHSRALFRTGLDRLILFTATTAHDKHDDEQQDTAADNGVSNLPESFRFGCLLSVIDCHGSPSA